MVDGFIKKIENLNKWEKKYKEVLKQPFIDHKHMLT